jgi:hypothetical protein
MNRRIVCLVAGLFAIGSAGLMIARAQPTQGAVFIAGDAPVSLEQIEAKLRADGWSNVQISGNSRYVRVTGLINGQPGKIAVDSQTGRLLSEVDDDDDD